MKLTCPRCAARYRIADERLEGLDGRRARIRCKKCGEAFLVDPPEPVGLIGARNEASVLFSLAALRPSESQVAPAATTSTDSSALIDLRALCATGATPRPATSRVDDIVNLGGAGAFAPLLAPVLPEAATPLAPDRSTPWRGLGLVVGAIGAVAVVVVVEVGVAATTRARHDAAMVSPPAASHPSPPPPSSSDPRRPLDAPSAAPPPTTSAAPPRARALTLTPPAAASPIVTTAASSTAPLATRAVTACCPGETDFACHVRLAAGAPCAAASSSPPPFDRAAAARALGVDLASCKRADGPRGPGHATLTLEPTGRVSAVDVDPPYAGTSAGACVRERYRVVTVPAFAGAPLTVGKTFLLP